MCFYDSSCQELHCNYPPKRPEHQVKQTPVMPVPVSGGHYGMCVCVGMRRPYCPMLLGARSTGTPCASVTESAESGADEKSQ